MTCFHVVEATLGKQVLGSLSKVMTKLYTATVLLLTLTCGSYPQLRSSSHSQ